MRSFDDRAAALFHKSQQRCAFHCASHRLPTVVWNFLERRAIGIGLRPVRRLRLLSGVDFVEQLADQAECVDLIIVRAGRETEQLRPQVRGVLTGRWPHRAQPASRRFAPSIRPDLVSDRDRHHAGRF